MSFSKPIIIINNQKPNQIIKIVNNNLNQIKTISPQIFNSPQTPKYSIIKKAVII